MSESRLDDEGRIPLPPEVRAALGWQPGQELLLLVEGDQLLVQPATPTATLKEEARRLAAAMRERATGTTRQLLDLLGSLVERPPARPPTGRPGERPEGVLVLEFEGNAPRWGAGVYLAPGCTLAGDVSLGDDVSLWPGAVVRGDVAPVRIGPRTNIQEGAVVHVSPQAPCTIGTGVTIGHLASVHACAVGDHTLIGIQAVVLDGARIGNHCIVAAGSVVTPGTEIPDGKMVMGIPARVVRDLTPQEIERIHWNADSYVALKDRYLRPRPAPPLPPVHEPIPKPPPPPPGALPRYTVRRAPGPIAIDGALDDPGWGGIAAASPLLLSDGSGTPTQETEVRACWDDECLYVSFACKDTDIWGRFEKRDDPLYEEEVVEVFLCPTGDLRHYFEFELSPNNVLFDARVFNPEGDRRTMLVDREWNAAGIRTAVRVSGRINDRASRDIGWIAELAIPFRDLGLAGPPAPGTVWRANFYRIERGEVTEFTAWSPTFRDPPDFHVPERFGELLFAE